MLLSVKVKLPVSHRRAFLVYFSHTIGLIKTKIIWRVIIAGGEIEYKVKLIGQEVNVYFFIK